MIAEPAVEVLTQPERRRGWSIEQKLAIVAETMRPVVSRTGTNSVPGSVVGVIVSAPSRARRHHVESSPAPIPLGQERERRRPRAARGSC
jgi:hypothetical protein